MITLIQLYLCIKLLYHIQDLKIKNMNASYAEILDVFKQLKIYIPLLEAFKQVPTNVKFLKGICTIKGCHNTHKKVFLTEQVSAWLCSEMSLKHKDPGCPTISCAIGQYNIDKAHIPSSPILWCQHKSSHLYHLQATWFRRKQAHTTYTIVEEICKASEV